MSDKRTRNWNFIVYPESAPENWVQILDDAHVPWVQSPLHDQDINADGSPKKPHWHCTIMFDSLKTPDQVKELLSPLNCTIPIVCNSPRGSVRYMAHMDNPEKHQYSTSDIVPHQGADIIELLKLTASCRHDMLNDMMAFVISHDVKEFSDLVEYAFTYHPEDWLPMLYDSCTLFMKSYITSRRHRELKLIKCDENGEIMD